MICRICNKGKFKNFNSLSNHYRMIHNITAKEYYDMFKDINEGICLSCGANTAFRGLKQGYLIYCSRKCSNSSLEVQSKTKNTWLEKYGVEHIDSSPIIQAKKRNTYFKKYGVDSQFKTEEFKRSQREYMKKGGSVYANSFVKNPSKPQVKLYVLAKSSYEDAKMNHPCLNYAIDVAIPSLMIAIEYDSTYWHQDNEEADKIRQMEIEKHGWKFIRYRDYVPTIDELNYKIKELTM